METCTRRVGRSYLCSFDGFFHFFTRRRYSFIHWCGHIGLSLSWGFHLSVTLLKTVFLLTFFSLLWLLLCTKTCFLYKKATSAPRPSPINILFPPIANKVIGYCSDLVVWEKFIHVIWHGLTMNYSPTDTLSIFFFDQFCSWPTTMLLHLLPWIF